MQQRKKNQKLGIMLYLGLLLLLALARLWY
jgi:hypothetical protein